MAAPTRAQIVADVTLPTFRVSAYTSMWDNLSAYVESFEPTTEAAGGDPTGIAMGPAVQPQLSVRFYAADGATLQSLRGYETLNRLVRLEVGFDTSDYVPAFTGVLAAWDGTDTERNWTVRGWDAVIEAAEVRSPVFVRRAIATRTSIGSVEDPSNPTYRGGLINYILWQCGGRPADQAASYPTARFYYSCTQALAAPEYSWIPGGNPWEVLRQLCRAGGGQIYQTGDGVMRYLDPITIATGTPTFTFSDEVLTASQRAAQGKAAYGSIADRYDSSIAVTGVTVSYITRRAAGPQTVYEDQVPRQIPGSGALTVTCDTSLPLLSIVRAECDAAVIRTAVKATPTVTAALSSAQRVSVTITNAVSDPIMVDAIRITARPVVAGEEGSASYVVSGERVVTADDSPYVQSEAHAAMLARMIYDGAANGGRLYDLADCGYDPDRYVGEVVGLTSSRYGLSAERCRIVRIRHDGAFMAVDLAPLGTLPTNDSVWLVGQITTGTKDLAY